MTGLRNGVADTPWPSGHVDALNGLVRAALAEIEPSLHPARAGHEVLARAEGKSDRGKGIMDTLQGLVNQMPGDDNARLILRTDAMRQTGGGAVLMLWQGWP